MISASNQNKKDKQNIKDEYQGMTKQQKQKKFRIKTLIQIVSLGCFFLLLTLTYSSFSHIVTFIYQRHDGYQFLGPLLLISNYGMFMLVNIFAPYVKVKYQKQFIIGACCYTINYALQIFGTLNPFGVMLLVLGSMLGGGGAAIVWVSQGGFMSALFQKYQIPYDHKGRYFGILNGIVFSNTLLGSLVTTFALGLFGDTQYFIILTCIGGLSIIFSTFILQDVQKNKKQYIQFTDEDEQLRNKSITTQNKPTKKTYIFSEDMNIKGTLRNIFNFAVKMKYFIPMIITDGAILGFVAASSTHLLPQDHYTKIQAGIFLVFVGAGSIIGGFLSGLFSDKFPIMKVGKSSLLMLGIGIFLSLPLFMELIENFVYSYFLGFVWGFVWHYMDGWLWVVNSKIFNGRLQSFALNKFLHSLSFLIYQFVLILYGTGNNLLFIEYFFFVLMALMVVSLIFVIKQQNILQKTLRNPIQ